MSIQNASDDEGNEAGGEVFLDENDVLEEINVDEEDLPEAGDDNQSEFDMDEADDSVHLFTGHTGEVYTIASSPTDALLVATGGGDDKAFLWKIGQGDWVQQLPVRKESVSSLVFSLDGQLLASGGFDGLIQVWDISSGSLKCTLEGPGDGIEWVKWHPRGHIVLAGSEDSTIWMWNADNGAYMNMFSGHGGSVTCGDFTPDGKLVCTGSDDASLRIWSPRSGESVHVVRDVENNGRILVTGDGHLYIEEIVLTRVRSHPYHNEGLTCLAITNDSTLVISGSKDGSVHVVNITTGRVVTSLMAHTDSIECVGLSQSPTHTWVATGSMDKKLIIWDLKDSSPRETCLHEEGVTCLTWIGTSNHVATGCMDGKVRIWDSLSGDCIKTFSGHSDGVQSLAVSGNYLVSVSLDATARVFELN